MDDPALRDLIERLQRRCVAAGLTVATAESCTGGLVAAALTELPGSSAYVRGGLVTYSDAAKVALLGVPEAVLEAHGAVSAPVAGAMASGARRAFGVSIAVSVTGIAGPDGGSDRKPVGLTFIGLDAGAGPHVRSMTWTGDRAANRAASVRAAVAWLLEAAEEAGS